MRKWSSLKNSKKPKRLFYTLYNKTRWFIKNLLLWIRCHTYNRYHLLDLRTKDYKYGWLDADYKMLHACFKCLEDFVEQEHPFVVLSWNDREDIKEEILYLYKWWKEDRFIEKKKLYEDKSCKVCNKAEAIMEREDFMLDRLIKIRHYLWT